MAGRRDQCPAHHRRNRRWNLRRLVPTHLRASIHLGLLVRWQHRAAFSARGGLAGGCV